MLAFVLTNDSFGLLAAALTTVARSSAVTASAAETI